MPSSIPPVHVGNDVIVNLKEVCYPIIEEKETNLQFRDWAWAQLNAVLGQSLQRYFNYDAEKRIAWAQYETGEVLKGWYPGVENPYPKPDSFSGPHPNPLDGVLGVGKDGFFDADSLVLPIGIHAGDFFLCHTEGLDVTPVVNSFAANYFQWVRFWGVLMWYRQGSPSSFWGTRGCSPDVTPNYWGQFRSFCQILINAKLKIHCAMGDFNNVPYGKLQEYYHNLANVISELGAEHFIFPGEGNEVRDTASDLVNENDFSRLENLVRIIHDRHPSILTGLGTYTGYNTDMKNPDYHGVVKNMCPSWQSVYMKHGDRSGTNSDKIRRTFNDGYEFYNNIRTWGYDDEHVGPGKHVSATDNKDDITGSTMGCMAVAAALSGQLYNYFCSPGIKYDEPFDNMPGYHTVGKLISMLPQDINKGILHHSGRSWINRDIPVFEATGDVRVDGRTNLATGEFCYLVHGPSDKVKLPVRKSAQCTIINPETLETNDIEARKNTSLPEIGLKDGFIIHGVSF